jgi:penicillin-binding protein 2
LKAVCSPGGTAFPLFDFSVEEEKIASAAAIPEEQRAAGKTGTAEFGDSEGRTHAWLTVFAPAEEPEIVVTVLLEGAGEGSYEAGPVTRKILDYWFHERG